MQIFYATNINDGLITLDTDEAHHAARVLRKRVGEVVQVVDGRGGRFTARFESIDRKHTTLRVLESERARPRAAFYLRLAVAPTKNMSRFEWMLEKATEIGVDVIIPLHCARSERHHLRTDRSERILLAAMKQSLQAWLPRLEPMTSFEDFLAREAGGAGQKFIAHLGPRSKGPLKDNYQPGKDVTIMIGPEGDFSGDEIRAALASGFEGVTLGPNRLRTETAALVACHTVNLLQLGASN